MKRFPKRSIGLLTAIMIIVMSAFSLFGCFTISGNDGNAYLEFKSGSIEMKIGEEKDVSSMISTNAGSYTLTSSAPDVVGISKTKMTALSAGIAYITATSDKYAVSGKLHVTVAEEDSFCIQTSGALFQTMGATSEVLFTPVAFGAPAAYNVKWYVNDAESGEKNVADSFSYTPGGAGEFVIKAVSAAASKFTDSATVNVYYPVTASGSAKGEFVQYDGHYTPITLTASIQGGQNQENTISWLVDGEAVYTGTEKEYTYHPSAGVHVITLYVNGVKRNVNGDTSLTVTCHGSIVPDGVKVVYDNMYPHLYISYNAVGKAAVEITSPGGAVQVYSQTDGRYSALFGPMGFDAAAYMRLCASGTQQNYKIRVKSLGDGKAYGESAYSEYVTFKQLPGEAEQYIQSFYLDKDHYITSDDEYVNIFEYYVIGRSKADSRPHVEFDCYIGYDLKYDAYDLWTYAFKIGATSGSYTGTGAERKGNVLHSEFTVSTVNDPYRQTYSVFNELRNKYSKQLHSNIPHINYDIEKYRPDDYEFAIDKLTRTETVVYSDELYYAAENGVRPLPAAGSSAETLYALARDVLKKIVTDDMTDVQKAHAIYDWIMWHTTYDTPATTVQRNGESYSAFYLEGVLGNGKTPIGGVVYYPYAVCDGLSKAYSLLCNIEGVPCKRVSGMAGSTVAGAGGHAWNKVFVDGAWYTVDCTWGDSTGELALGSRYKTEYELGLHDWLFVTDQMAGSTHFEPYNYQYVKPDWGTCKIDYFPKTARTPYGIYREMTYNGVKINCEVTRGEDQGARAAEIATAFARAYKARNTVYVPGYGSGNYTVDYESIEIYFDGGCELSDALLTSKIAAAITAVRPQAKYEVLNTDGNVVLVLIKDK